MALTYDQKLLRVAWTFEKGYKVAHVDGEYLFLVDKIPNAKPECKTHDIQTKMVNIDWYMCSFLDRSKTIPFGTAHTYVAHIR